MEERIVTLPKGVVVTDAGPAVVNGQPDEGVRRMRCVRTGQIHHVLRSVVEALPDTVRRSSFARRPGDLG